MLIASLVVFCITALGGLALALLQGRGRAVPVPVALIHGASAAGGFLVLSLALMRDESGMLAPVAIAMFILAACLGLTLFVFHWQRHSLPVPVIVLHAMAALSGIALLVAAIAGLG